MALRTHRSLPFCFVFACRDIVSLRLKRCKWESPRERVGSVKNNDASLFERASPCEDFKG